MYNYHDDDDKYYHDDDDDDDDDDDEEEEEDEDDVINDVMFSKLGRMIRRRQVEHSSFFETSIEVQTDGHHRHNDQEAASSSHKPYIVASVAIVAKSAKRQRIFPKVFSSSYAHVSFYADNACSSPPHDLLLATSRIPFGIDSEVFANLTGSRSFQKSHFDKFVFFFRFFSYYYFFFSFLFVLCFVFCIFNNQMETPLPQEVAGG